MNPLKFATQVLEKPLQSIPLTKHKITPGITLPHNIRYNRDIHALFLTQTQTNKLKILILIFSHKYILSLDESINYSLKEWINKY